MQRHLRMVGQYSCGEEEVKEVGSVHRFYELE